LPCSDDSQTGYCEGFLAAGPASVPGLAVAPGAPAATFPPCPLAP
jgi:hypothetical protein